MAMVIRGVPVFGFVGFFLGFWVSVFLFPAGYDCGFCPVLSNLGSVTS